MRDSMSRIFFFPLANVKVSKRIGIPRRTNWVYLTDRLQKSPSATNHSRRETSFKNFSMPELNLKTKPRLFMKAYVPMKLTVDGMVICSSDGQPANAPLSIRSSPSHSSTDLNFVQPRNASTPITWTVDGMAMLSSDVHGSMSILT